MSGQNKKQEKYLNIFVSVGAAVVIFGAWSKILHLSFADTMLTVGLLTEAAIFLVYAFIPPHNDMEGIAEALKGATTTSGDSVSQSMDQMFAKAGINEPMMKKLGDNFEKFGTTVEKIGNISDAHIATTEYAQKTKEASLALTSMKDAYQNATTSVGHIGAVADSSRLFHEQIQAITKNLSSLNTVYELELQDTNNHLKAMNAFYTNLSKASQAMEGSVTDAQKTQEQISLLARNLGSLNQVYGNMLSAMQGRQA